MAVSAVLGYRSLNCHMLPLVILLSLECTILTPLQRPSTSQGQGLAIAPSLLTLSLLGFDLHTLLVPGRHTELCVQASHHGVTGSPPLNACLCPPCSQLGPQTLGAATGREGVHRLRDAGNVVIHPVSPLSGVRPSVGSVPNAKTHPSREP